MDALRTARAQPPRVRTRLRGVGCEQDWFLHCAESVATMGADELISTMDEVRHLSQAVGDRWDALAVRSVPDRLTFSPGEGSTTTPDVLRLIGYSPFDPLVLPAALLADLRTLDGRPIAHVRQGINPQSNALGDDLLALLHDFGVATPPTQ